MGCSPRKRPPAPEASAPGEPLRISADVEVNDDEEVVAELKVAGKRATDLRYEASLTPRS